MGAKPLCSLMDCTLEYFSDEEGWLPAVPGDMYAARDVGDYLRLASARRPHMVRMDLPGRLRAWVAIGGPWGSVGLHHLLRDNTVPADHPPDWHVVTDRPPPVDFVAFLTEGSTAEVDIGSRCLIPAEEVIGIAAHIAEHRTLPRTHAWLTHDGRGTAIYAGRDRPWEDRGRPIYRYFPGGDVPF